MAVVNFEGVMLYFDTRSTEQWAAVTKVIPKGYLCVELTTDGKSKLKVGDGTSTYGQLAYVAGSTGDVDLSDYYTKDDTDKAITKAISNLGTLFTCKGKVSSVDELPAEDNTSGTVYLVGAEDATEYAEYYWTGTMWDYMGKTSSVDLSGYYTKTEVDAAVKTVADKVKVIEDDYVKSTDTLVINCSLS